MANSKQTDRDRERQRPAAGAVEDPGEGDRRVLNFCDGIACHICRMRLSSGHGHEAPPTGAKAMGLIILLVVLFLLFGGGGFYYGPPYHYYGGGLGLVLLIVVLVLLFRGRA
jgi:hypothetical protein